MENESTRSDRRTRKTKKAIKEAFLNLLAKKDVSKISVTDISDLADINRKTFYSHYSGVSAVTDEVENDLVDQFMGLMGDYDMAALVSNPYPVLKQLTKVINEDIEFYGRLFKDGVSGTILEKVKKGIHGKLTLRFAETAEVDPALLNYTVSYFISGLLGAFEAWFNCENAISLEKLSKHLSMITTSGLKAIHSKLYFASVAE